MTSKSYQKHSERLQNEACEKYQNLSEEEKEKGSEKDIKILLNNKS